MKVLYVCTANICRSPSAAAILRDACLPDVQVTSAGTVASDGSPGCAMATALQGRSDQHRSQRLTAGHLAWADLVLTAAREHQPAVVSLDPRARSRTFTIRQAGRLAQWLLDAGMVEAARSPGDFEQGDPRAFVSPLQGDVTRWLVDELDAARGMAPASAPPDPPKRRLGRRQEQVPHPDDVPDPHVMGFEWHEPAGAQIAESTAQLVALILAVQAARQRRGGREGSH